MAATPAVAQVEPVLLDSVDVLNFDRPESWAMKYFTSVSLLTGLGTQKPMDKGSVEIGFEGGLVPALGEEKRRVGFIGSKVEDLNRTSLFGRARVTFGLAGGVALTLGATPPVEVNGVTPKLFDLAVGRSLVERPGFRLGGRVHARSGSIEGDLTCSADVAGVEDPATNPDDCREPSNDEVTQHTVGLELSVSPRTQGDRWEPHFAVSANYMDLEFQVRARYSRFLDRTRLVTEGWTSSVSAGLGYRASDRLRFSGELFYTPLEVVRDPLRGTQNDELVNARVLASYRVR